VTVETDIDALVSSTTVSKDRVVSSKAALTASVADALAARNTAQDTANAIAVIRDEIEGHATIVSTASTAEPIADLKGIDVTTSSTAIDVLVYDTTKDSDGGAWRKRTQDASWYNEPLAGKWLGIHPDENSARNAYANLGSELAANGTFDDASSLNDWIDASATGGSIAWNSSGYLDITNTTGIGRAQQAITNLVVGNVYRFSIENVGTDNLQYFLGTSLGGTQVKGVTTVNGGDTAVFQFTATSTYLGISIDERTAGDTCSVDNVSVREVISLTTETGDYYQRSTDGNFYKLNAGSGTTEVFRGGRAEFPSTAVIVAEANRVIIYDGDGPTLPMWISITGSRRWIWDIGTLSVTALNGTIFIGNKAPDVGWSGNGLYIWNFVADTGDAVTRGYNPSYSPGPFELGSGVLDIHGVSQRSHILVNYGINDVAVAVLPDAPIDDATGLPIPTIAVATDGGASVIKDDGTVVDITHTSSQVIENISLNDEGLLFTTRTGTANTSYFHHLFYEIPTSDVANGTGYSGSTADEFYTHSEYGSGKLPLYRSSTNGFHIDDKLSLGGSEGLQSVYRSTSVGVALYNATTTTHNTGWMVGDIKGAFLSDTDDTYLVGSELVTNGTFGTDTGWTKGTGWTIGSGVATVVGDGSALVQTNILGNGVAKIIKVSWDQTITSGTRFRFFARNDTDGANAAILSGSATGGATFSANNGYCYGSGTFTVYVQTTDGFSFKMTVASGNDGTLDNISVVEADADRSVNDNPLIVNGTITRSPVATGADLVAYSGFSTTNYLQQEYNSDLDFGTGDFCIMGWGRTNINGTFLSRGDGVSAGSWYWRHLSGSTSPFYIHDGTAFRLALNVALPQGDMVHFALLRRSGTVYLYGNGELVGSLSGTYPALSMSNTTAKLRVGDQQHSSYTTPNEKLALLRISGTAPSAEQIKKIYGDEKELFKESAKCTLYGTSDSVEDLAFDDSTNLLHVGTDDGRSSFNGLERVSHTDDDTGGSISAAGGLIVGAN
jgi:trimeric autotransporter adhesin